MQLDANDLKQKLTDNLNAHAQISAWCAAIVNTAVAPSPGDWYAPFMANLAKAQQHTTDYLNIIGPDAFSNVPNAIVNYSSTHNNGLGDVQQILNQVGDDDLTADQISKIIEIFQALQQYLNTLLGTSQDSNMGNPPPAQPTLYGTKNDIATFRDTITSDNKTLTTGQQGAAAEVALLEVDEMQMNSDIQTLQEEITALNQEIVESEIGLGVSIFVTVIGIAFAPVSGGTALVLSGIGIAGIGGSIGADVYLRQQVKDAYDQVAADQAELNTDQQQVNALNIIINSLQNLGNINEDAQTAVENVLETFTALIDDTNNTITALQSADSGQAKGILEKLDIQNAMSDWTNLASLAQGILNSTLNPQVLTPPNAKGAAQSA